ncbi:hypothetical protein [Streptomyces sp. NPDC055243]|uniref:hypothetical protein n=1 Tax=Streptomyces sp. NPDC055243 TaxID=3365720 RepID=UPI0037D59BEA
MTAAWVVEPCGPSDTSPLIGEDTDPRPADIRGQRVSEEQWAGVQDVNTGEWL